MKNINIKHILVGMIILIIMIPIALFSPLLLILKKFLLTSFVSVKLLLKNPKFWISAKKFTIKHAALKFTQEAGIFIVKKYTNWDRLLKYYILKLKIRANRIKRQTIKTSKKYKISVVITSFFTSTGVGIGIWSAWKYIWTSILGFFFKILIKPILLILITGLDLILAPVLTLFYDLMLNLLLFLGVEKVFKKHKKENL